MVPLTNTKTTNVNLRMSIQQNGTKDRLRQQIQHAIENRLAIRADDVSTLTQTPSDGIQGPGEDGPEGNENEKTLDIAADHRGVLHADDQDHVRHHEEGDAADGEVAPFVAALRQGADQASDYHDFVAGDRKEDGVPCKAAGEQDVQDDERCRDEPVYARSVRPLIVCKSKGCQTYQSM